MQIPLSAFKTCWLFSAAFVLLFACVLPLSEANAMARVPDKRPNILFAISDDQSYPHASAYGATSVRAPAFDRVAAEGILFHNAFAMAPQCSPNRAAILTGRPIWSIREAGTHSSHFPGDLKVFTQILADTGYKIGYTGKPWGPGNWEDNGWAHNPVGPAYNEIKLNPPSRRMSNLDYAANFEQFLEDRDEGQAFFFWYGAKEPHLGYEDGTGVRAGKQLKDADLPPFLPDSETVRSELLDYALEIDWFDKHLARMLQHLESIGELENTIVIVTSDNGMPFPYAKANLTEYGIHVPLAIRAPEGYFTQGRESSALISHIDLAPTILEWAGAPNLPEATGKSLVPLLKEGKNHRDAVFSGRERHTHARTDNLGYPSRSIRTDQYLLIWNLHPDRWPAGMPRPEGLTEAQYSGDFSNHGSSIGNGYRDIDGSNTKRFVFSSREELPFYFQLAFQKRPELQLFDVRKDPGCLRDLGQNPDYQETVKELHARLKTQLIEGKDPRLVGDNPDVFESYPRFGGMRYFPGFKEYGKYNPKYQK